MKLSGAGWRRWKNDHRGTCKVSHVRVKRCPRSSDFPKRSILSRPRDPSLCCKPRLKAVVCQFRKRYREFESTSLHQPVPQFPDIAENRAKSARVRDFPQACGTREAVTGALTAEKGRILSGRDSGGSIANVEGTARERWERTISRAGVPVPARPQLGKIEASSEVNDGQFGRLTALDDRLYNPRRQESERQDLPYVAPGHAGSPGDVADRCGRSDTLSRMRSPITSRSN
jgi:hypothetical protein